MKPKFILNPFEANYKKLIITPSLSPANIDIKNQFDHNFRSQLVPENMWKAIVHGLKNEFTF